MPFDEDEVSPSKQSGKIGLKGQGQKSVFDSLPKKPTQADLDDRVKEVSQRNNSYKQRAAELTVQFNRAMSDKTLTQNRNVFTNDAEQELLLNMVRLAQEVNADPNEREGEGSLSWIIILLKNCFAQRDRINHLEFSLLQIDRKFEALKKEFEAQSVALDKK